MGEVKAWPLKTYRDYGDPAHAMDLRDFAVRYAGLPSEEETLATVADYLGRATVVDPRDIEDVYRCAHTVMRVQQELQKPNDETSVAKLEELVRTLLPRGK
jgi:hypothetical protein